MGKQLLLLGGGHAHMVTLARLDEFVEKGHQVTVVGPSDYHYYSGMGPGMLGKTYRPDDIRFATRHVVEKKGATFVRDKVVAIDAENKEVTLREGAVLNYDVVSCNLGSHVSRKFSQDAGVPVYTVKPIERLLEARKELTTLFRKKECRIAIIGGGPSTAEVAGNVWQLARKTRGHMPKITIFAGSRLMGNFPPSVSSRVCQTLAGRVITIHENDYVESIAGNEITLTSGEKRLTDFIFMATGVKPNAVFADSGLPTGPEGGLEVNQYLQSPRYPEIFGGGDCIYFAPQPLDKVGVYAVRQNPVLFENLMAALEDRPLTAFNPGGDYLLIFNLGGKMGVFCKKSVAFGGRPAFIIKDFIDRRFMKEFQAIE